MKLYDFIFCDDIRYEQNNKLSLMGLYNDCIIIKSNKEDAIKWPIPMSLALLLRFKRDTGDEKPDTFELEYFIDKKSIVTIQGPVNIANPSLSTFNLIMRNQGMPIAPGILGFTVKLLKKGKLLCSKNKKNAIKILHEAI